MLDILHRSAMGRIAVWRSPSGTVGTPAIAYVDSASRPAPPFAEVRVTDGLVREGGVTFALSGSVFAPKDPTGGIPLPRASGHPLSLTDLDAPSPPVGGPVASVTRPEDAAHAEADLLLLDCGPEFVLSARRFVRFLVDTRDAAGPTKLVWLPGVAAPSNLAVLAYCGIDVVDSARMRWDGARGGFHTIDGLLPFDAVDPGLCDCQGCSRKDPTLHNETDLAREMRAVRQAIRLGTLRELAERRAVADPWSIAVLRHLDLREYAFQEPFFPVADGSVRAYTPAALTRPDVERFRRRLVERYTKPPSARVAVLLPCSARKPYSRSRSHRLFREAIRRSGRASAVHEVILTSPFGVVPRELEVVYPIRSYDVPVTGDWSRDEAEAVTESLARYLAQNRYDAVIANVGPEAAFVAEAAPEAVLTAVSKPLSGESLAGLAAAVSDATRDLVAPPWETRRLEDLASLAAYQFGPAGRELLKGAAVKGRPEAVRILRGGRQLGAMTDRGQLSLTLAGAEAIAAHKVHTVEIEDFHPAGNVFAVGVTAATPDIRIGDEVAVAHGGEVRAAGTAQMPWREMVDAARGEAVRVRHHLPSGKG